MESILNPIIPFLNWLLDKSIYAILLIMLILAIRTVLKKHLSVRWVYMLWLILIATMFIPDLLQTAMSPHNLVKELPVKTQLSSPEEILLDKPAVNEVAPINTSAPTVAESASTQQATPEQIAPDDTSFISFTHLIVLIWLTGAIIMFAWIAIGNFLFWKKVYKEKPSTDSRILNILEDCKSILNMNIITAVIPSNSISSPALFGFIRPRILLPQEMIETLSDDDLRYVFLHELCHIKRNDILVSWLMSVLEILHWFNPFIWYAFSKVRHDRELACDSKVLSSIHENQSIRYGHTIISLLERFAQQQYLPSMAGLLESKALLKRRLQMIAQFRKNNTRCTVLAATILAAFTFVAITSAQNKKPIVLGNVPSKSAVKDAKQTIENWFDACKAKSPEKIAQQCVSNYDDADSNAKEMNQMLTMLKSDDFPGFYKTLESKKELVFFSNPMELKDETVSEPIYFIWQMAKQKGEWKIKRVNLRVLSKRLNDIKLFDPNKANGSSSEISLMNDNDVPAASEKLIDKTAVVKFRSKYNMEMLSIDLYGATYGDAGNKKFYISLYDGDMMLIKKFDFDYSMFSSNPQWITLKIRPENVPDDLIYIAVDTKSNTDSGIMLFHDGEKTITSSIGSAARPDDPLQSADGNWLIRAAIRTTYPVVVESVPAVLDNAVSPNLDKITVRFDRRMRSGSWSWTGGGDTFPKSKRLYYEEGNTLACMDAQLEPGRVYVIGINSPSHRNFKSASGISSKRHILIFATADAQGNPTPIPDKLIQTAKQINGN